MDESNALEIPLVPVEVDMVVGDTPIVLPDDQVPEDPPNEKGKNSSPLPMYADEMLRDGLIASDMSYFNKAYQSLKDVIYIKLHCTSCDKHIGSAPNALSERLEHPLLRVLMCKNCAVFYSSGEFLKDKDGSELYCRWCGEGGSVFCCTKCPFVFCKRCITRNIGRGKANVIEYSADWMCFACNPGQIDKHRATYWAIQKYSALMLQKYKDKPDDGILSLDSNACCSEAPKRASDRKGPPSKKPKIDAAASLLKSALEKHDQDHDEEIWKTPFAAESEAEVICTPDIIPIDDSPVPSPEPPSSPVLRPLPVLQAMPKQNYIVRTQLPSLTPIMRFSPRLTAPANLFIATSQMPPHVISHQNNTYILKKTPNPSHPVLTNQLNSNLKLVLTKTEPPREQHQQIIIKPGPSSSKPVQSTDWFNFALSNCTEITEYISSKITGLSSLYGRAHKSTTLMEEVHNTLQTYLDVAINKLSKMKAATKKQFDSDITQLKKNLVMDPIIAVERKRGKPKKASSPNRKNDLQDVPLDMDVTNESDEATESHRSSACSSPVSVQKITNGEESVNLKVEPGKSETETPIITVEDSEDDADDITDTSVETFIKKMKNLIECIESKVTVNMPQEELIKYLSAIVVIKNGDVSQKAFDNIAKQDVNKKQDLQSMIYQNAKSNLSNTTNNGAKVEKSDDPKNLKQNSKTKDTLSSKTEEIPGLKIDTVHSSKKEDLANSKIIDTLNENVAQNDDDTPSTIEEDILSSEKKAQSSKENSPLPMEDQSQILEDEKMDEPYDVEDILSANIVVRQPMQMVPTQQNTTNIDPTALFLSEIEGDTIDKTQINMARALDFIPDDVNDIINKDNGSLSLPPDSTEFCMDDIVRNLKLVSDKVHPENRSLFANSSERKENNSDEKNENPNNGTLGNDILELRHIAEACVKVGGECKT